jgi:ceramide glucosyltransferase
MPHALALAVEIATTAFAVAGIGYYLASMLAASVYLRERRTALPAFAPNISILKSLKGLDPGMLDAFRSHCRQIYAGDYELLFGVSSLDDPAVSAVIQLQSEFPERTVRLIECPQTLGANGKVSTLAQLIPHARHEILLINDSDISVNPHYLARVAAFFGPSAQPPVGLVTTLYRGRAHGTMPSHLEALGIATDFQAGVLLSKMLEGGLHYGLGSTLAVSREALEKAGGLLPLVDHLADDYELGARVAHAGYRVALSPEVVETNLPAYRWRGFIDHQLRWLRTVRDSRPWGYAGLIFTHLCTRCARLASGTRARPPRCVTDRQE